MGIFNFSNENKADEENNSESKRGLLGYLDLLDWFNSLKESEKNKIIKYYGADKNELLEDELLSSAETKEGFFANIARGALYNRDLELALKYLKIIHPEQWRVDAAHFFYQSLIPLFYKFRDTESGLNNTILYCKKNIELIKEHKEELLDYFSSIPNFGRKFPAIDCFRYLAIIYKNEGKVDKAIEVCQEAISLGVNADSQNISYKNRLEKLIKRKKKL